MSGISLVGRLKAEKGWRWRVKFPFRYFYSDFVKKEGKNEVGMRNLKVLFFGTDDFALASLRHLRENQLKGGAVKKLEVCVADTKSLVCSVKKFALKEGLPLHSWTVLKRKSSPIALNFNLGVVSSFGHLIPNKIIQQFRLGILNVHGSLLPRWRGATPIIHSLLHGDNLTGISIMEIRPHRFDTGPILATRSLKVDRDIRRKELTEQMAEIGGDLLSQVLNDLPKYYQNAHEQSTEGITRAPILKDKNIFIIDWKNKAELIYNQWRALGDISKLRTFLTDKNGEKIVMLDKFVRIESDQEVRAALNTGVHHWSKTVPLETALARPGLIVYLKRKEILAVRTGNDSWVGFERIYVGNKKVMNPRDFFNGYMSKFQPSYFETGDKD